MDEHGKTSGADPKILPALPAWKQYSLVFCFMTNETGDLFFLSHFYLPFKFNLIDHKK
jgi:hypothetical protein